MIILSDSIKMETLCTMHSPVQEKSFFSFSPSRMSKFLFVIILMKKLSEARKGSSSCRRHYSRSSSRFQPAGSRVQRRYSPSRSWYPKPSGNFHKHIFRSLTKLEIFQKLFKCESKFSRR